MSGVLTQKPPSSQTRRLTNEARVTGGHSPHRARSRYLGDSASSLPLIRGGGNGQSALVNVVITTTEIAPYTGIRPNNESETWNLWVGRKAGAATQP